GESWRMQNVKRSGSLSAWAVPDHPARTLHARKNGDLVGFPILIAINATQNSTAIALRINRSIFVHGDEQHAIDGRTDAGGISDAGWPGKDRRFVPFREFDRFKNLRVGAR